jgi:hypothetical protein
MLADKGVDENSFQGEVQRLQLELSKLRIQLKQREEQVFTVLEAFYQL